MSAENVVEVTKDTWQQSVMQSPTPVLVDFSATWCGPCRALAPTLGELAAELKGKLKVVAVDVDANPDLAAQFRVRSVPTLLVIEQGTVKGQMVGAMSKAALKAKLSTYIAL